MGCGCLFGRDKDKKIPSDDVDENIEDKISKLNEITNNKSFYSLSKLKIKFSLSKNNFIQIYIKKKSEDANKGEKLENMLTESCLKIEESTFVNENIKTVNNSDKKYFTLYINITKFNLFSEKIKKLKSRLNQSNFNFVYDKNICNSKSNDSVNSDLNESIDDIRCCLCLEFIPDIMLYCSVNLI